MMVFFFFFCRFWPYWSLLPSGQNEMIHVYFIMRFLSCIQCFDLKYTKKQMTDSGHSFVKCGKGLTVKASDVRCYHIATAPLSYILAEIKAGVCTAPCLIPQSILKQSSCFRDDMFLWVPRHAKCVFWMDVYVNGVYFQQDDPFLWLTYPAAIEIFNGCHAFLILGTLGLHASKSLDYLLIIFNDY